MELIAKLKHWQVFLVLFGTMYLPVLTVGSEMGKLSSVFFFTLNLVMYLVWVHTIGVVSKRYVVQEIKRNLRFNIFASVYVVVFIASMIIFVEHLGSNIFIILPFHIVALGCLAFNVGTAAKSLVSATSKSDAPFSSYSGTIFKIWIYPIGIWKVQNQLNSLVEPNQ
ncbi:hypothetical protein [Reinekea sp. G2M2-21]|uniref:hypothetical protein n=1 Tax=Reinekea sp. G2M2-21 TaxID=2788942 RepID=UPI0018A98E56|nr:hypothetical protein [Reinekea sp. G2M2-21]